MATIKLENVAATASITIQLIKDYSMYNSEIISSNGTIFQSTDTSTTLTFRIYKGVEDITDKITDIVWSKFYFVNDELREEYEWGNDKKNKTKIVLDKDDLEEKSIIQASGYSMIEGHRELVTTARITMIKISDVYISDITPTNPSNNMMWMDMNTNPPILKLWNEELGVWITSGADVPVVKNIIRNSNFWTDLDEYYEIENSSHINEPGIVTYQSKRWVNLQSKNNNSQSGGIRQEIQYPITSNSNYMFSCIAYRDTGHNGTDLRIRINSINSNNKTTTIIDTNETINTSITSIEVPFKTLVDTEKLTVFIGTQNKANCSFNVTELSLYNSSVYYPWELCPEDVDKQMNSKLDNNRLSVYNALTDNGNYKFLYEYNNQYYVRASYIIPELTEKDDFDSLEARVLTLENQKLNEAITQLQTKCNTLETNYNTLLTNYNTLQTKYTDLESRITALENDNDDGNEGSEPETPTQQ